MTPPPRPHVMIVDDELVFLKLGKLLAEQAGVEITMVDNGRVAVETATAKRFDLILMDVTMPTIDGPGATKMIRKIEAEAGLPRTPIVAVTSHIPDRIRAAMQATGMDDVVAKPITLKVFQDLLARRYDPMVEAPGAVGGIDLTDLKRLCITDRDMQELLEAFREGVASSEALMEKGLATQERRHALRGVHSLKGLYAQVGARAAARRMEEIETKVREQGIDGVAELWRSSRGDRKQAWDRVETYMAEQGLL